MEQNEYELIVSQPKNPIWKIILAGFFFGYGIRSIVHIVSMPHFSHLEDDEKQFLLKNIVLLMIGLAMGFYFSARTTILIDTDTEKLVSRHFLGFFTATTTSKIPELNRITITKNEDDDYLIKLWYQGNKRFTMCYTEDKKAAFEFATMASQKLKIDLFDNSEKGISKWINEHNT